MNKVEEAAPLNYKSNRSESRSDHEPEPEKSGFVAGVVNTMNLMIGGGILSMPYVASSLGYVNFTICSIIVALLSLFTVDLLVQAAEELNVRSYEDVAEKAIYKVLPIKGIGKRVVGASLFLTSVACVVGYGFAIKSQAPEVIKTLLVSAGICVDPDIWYLNGNFIYGIVTICITLPISFAKSLDFLKWPSMIGMCSMILTILVLCFYKLKVDCVAIIQDLAGSIVSSYTLSDASSTATSNQTEALFGHPIVNGTCMPAYQPNEKALEEWGKFSHGMEAGYNRSLIGQPYCYTQPQQPMTDDFTQACLVLFAAWLSHAGILTIYDSLENPNRKNMAIVTGTGYLFCYVMNVGLGLCGYFTWNEFTISDVLLMYSKSSSTDYFIFSCRIFVNMTVLFSIPMVLFFGRVGFFSMINSDTDDDTPPKDTSLYIYDVLFLAATYIGVAWLAKSLGAIFALAGVICVILGFILPAIIWSCTFKDSIGQRMPTFLLGASCLIIGVLGLALQIIYS